MNTIDMRTVVFLNTVIFFICTLFILQLWLQNRGRFVGIGFWVYNFALQTAALALIMLRGAIPDWMSIVLANTLVLAGALLTYIGLERFLGKAGTQLHNYVLFALYIGAFVYSTFIHPDLHLRILISSVGLLIIGLQCVWLLWRRVKPDQRSLTFWVGAVFGFYCLAGVARIVEYFVGELGGGDYFQAGAFQTLMFVVYILLLLLLTHSLVLMVNRRLVMEMGTYEEALKQMHDELEQRVADRTADLSRVNAELQKEINKRKQSEEKIIFQAKLLNAVEQAVIATDQCGNIVYLNPAAEKLYGWSEHEVLGKNVNDFFTAQEIEEKGKEILDLLMKGASWKGEFLVTNKQGKNFYAEVNDAPVLDDSGILIGIIGISYDITARKQAEEEIRLLNTELEQRVRERTAELVAINEELEDLNYSIAHDLRAPLRHLDGFVGLLNQHLPKGLDEKSLHCLKVISDSAVKMGRLLDDVLSFSSLGRVEMNRTRFNMETLLNEVLKMVQPELQDREIVWSIGPLPEVYGDPTLLKIVLTNLISNAVKFTNRNPQAVIEIGHSSDQAKEEVFYVKDNGAGFDMQYQNKLFNLFQRLHHERDFKGTGLGLANIRRIIERHGGRVWAEGAVDQGATFYFSLPKRGNKAGSE